MNNFTNRNFRLNGGTEIAVEDEEKWRRLAVVID